MTDEQAQKMADLIYEKNELKFKLNYSEIQNKTLKRALLIACDGDTNKAVACIDRTITEPENK